MDNAEGILSYTALSKTANSQVSPTAVFMNNRSKSEGIQFKEF